MGITPASVKKKIQENLSSIYERDYVEVAPRDDEMPALELDDIPGMIERRAGDVIFVGSDTAVRPRTFQAAYSAAKAGLESFARVLEMETEGTGVRSVLMRVGPTGSEFGNQMPKDRLPEILEEWKYWGLYRKQHWMRAEDVACAIVRVAQVPVEESYTTIVEVQPGGRRKEYQR